MITLDKLLKLTGIRKRTFRFYKEKGLIQVNVVIKGLGGKGTISYYPDYVFHDLMQIKRLKKEGKTLKEIGKYLHEGEYKEEKKFKKVINPNENKTWQGIYEEVKRAFPGKVIFGLDTEIYKRGDREVMVTTRIRFCPHKKPIPQVKKIAQKEKGEVK